MKRRDFLIGSTSLLGVARAGAASLPCAPLVFGVQGPLGSSTSTSCSTSLYPAWIDVALSNGWTVNTWASISGSSPTHGLSATNVANDVVPSGATALNDPASVMNAWCGGALATHVGTYGKFLCWGGGHDDYFGNEIYGFDLASRSWSLLSQPYTGVSWPNSSGWWPASGAQINGSPGVPHTYDGVEYSPTRNSFYTFKCQTNNSPSTSIPKVGEFNLTTGIWTPRATCSQGIGGTYWSAYDSRRDLFLFHGDGGGSAATAVYNPSADTFSYYTPSGSAGLGVTDCSAAYDPVNDIVVVMRPDTGVMLALNAANLSQDIVTLTTSGKPSIVGGAGFEYCAELGGFVWYHDGAGVYLVTKGSGTWNTATWTWTLLTSGSNTITPENTDINSIYSRFRIARHGAYVVAYTVKRTGRAGGGAMYAFLLSTSGGVS